MAASLHAPDQIFLGKPLFFYRYDAMKAMLRNGRKAIKTYDGQAITEPLFVKHRISPPSNFCLMSTVLLHAERCIHRESLRPLRHSGEGSLGTQKNFNTGDGFGVWPHLCMPPIKFF